MYDKKYGIIGGILILLTLIHFPYFGFFVIVPLLLGLGIIALGFNSNKLLRISLMIILVILDLLIHASLYFRIPLPFFGP